MTMCGRFAIASSKDEMLEYLQEYFDIYDPGIEFRLPRYNIAPGEMIPAVVYEGDRRYFRLLKWGFVPDFARKDAKPLRLINAKSETVREKPAFRSAFRRRRCLIPVTGFFEWQATGKGKVPYYITVKNRPIFALAGIWDEYRTATGEAGAACAILTTAAGGELLSIHERMPVIVDETNFGPWLDDGIDPGKLGALFFSIPGERLALAEVSTAVNRPANDTIECITPVNKR